MLIVTHLFVSLCLLAEIIWAIIEHDNMWLINACIFDDWMLVDTCSCRISNHTTKPYARISYIIINLKEEWIEILVLTGWKMLNWCWMSIGNYFRHIHEIKNSTLSTICRFHKVWWKNRNWTTAGKKVWIEAYIF